MKNRFKNMETKDGGPVIEVDKTKEDSTEGLEMAEVEGAEGGEAPPVTSRVSHDIPAETQVDHVETSRSVRPRVPSKKGRDFKLGQLMHQFHAFIRPKKYSNT